MEAAVVFAVMLLIAYNLSFIPLIPRIIGFILIAGPLTLIAAVGINDEALSSYIMSFFIFRSTRCTVKLRMPMPHVMTEQERKAAKIEEKTKEKEAKKEKLEKNKEKAKGMFGKLFKKGHIN